MIKLAGSVFTFLMLLLLASHHCLHDTVITTLLALHDNVAVFCRRRVGTTEKRGEEEGNSSLNVSLLASHSMDQACQERVGCTQRLLEVFASLSSLEGKTPVLSEKLVDLTRPNPESSLRLEKGTSPHGCKPEKMKINRLSV